MNSLFLDALNCRNRSRPPLWLMRQAGRYLPEYRQLREKYSFLQMCHSPEIAAEVTQLPIRRFGFDAAIIFSDILVLPEALGLGLHFDEGKGPILDDPLESSSDIDRLPRIDVRDRLGFVEKTIQMVKPSLQVPLIGFAGAPFTVASYMIEGKSSRDWIKTKRWMLRDPESFTKLLDLIADYTIEYLTMQVEAGVQALQIFDSWAHVLSHEHFRSFSLKYLHKISRALKHKAPVILFCKGSSVFAPLMVEAEPAGISLDWNADLKTIRKEIPQRIALQGNLDPDILLAPLATIRKEASILLNKMKGERGYIFNLGHGIRPDVPLDAVQTLVETVHES